jgi:hypothetical protein
MPTYKAPVEDVTFLLNDVFQIDRYDNLPGFTDASADVREAIIGEAAKLSEEVLQPLNRTGTMTTASPRRRVSRKPSSRSPKAAGSVCPRRRNMAGKGCRSR